MLQLMEVCRENVRARGDPSAKGQGSPFAAICMFRLVPCAPLLKISLLMHSLFNGEQTLG
jgi:hypothetical protein